MNAAIASARYKVYIEDRLISFDLVDLLKYKMECLESKAPSKSIIKLNVIQVENSYSAEMTIKFYMGPIHFFESGSDLHDVIQAAFERADQYIARWRSLRFLNLKVKSAI